MSDARLERLRREFDATFAERPDVDTVRVVDLLAIRVGGVDYVVRLLDVASLASDRKIVAVPSPIDEALGVAGIRGVVVPVYSLAALLGHPRAQAARWLLVCAGLEPLAVAFDDLVGFFRLAAADIVPASAAAPHLSHTVRLAGRHLAVIELRSIALRLTQEP